MSEINGPGPLADMRDIRALRKLIESEASANLLFRAQVRRHLGIAEDEAADPERETLSPPTWLERANTWMAARPTNRALLLLYGLAVAAVAVSLSGCLAHPLAHALLTGRSP